MRTRAARTTSGHPPNCGRAREGQGPALGQTRNDGAGGSRTRRGSDEASNGALSGGGTLQRRAQPEPIMELGRAVSRAALAAVRSNGALSGGGTLQRRAQPEPIMELGRAVSRAALAAVRSNAPLDARDVKRAPCSAPKEAQISRFLPLAADPEPR